LEPAFLPGGSLAKQGRDRFGFDQLARLIEVVVDDRLWLDADGVIDRRQQFTVDDRL
jgi:hypothetical protein